MADDRIGRASVFLASGTVVSRVLGFVKAIVLAAAIGVIGSSSADAFAVANGLPNTVYVIVAGGVLSAVLVPQIVRASTHTDGGSAYINKLLTLALVVIGAATVIATLLAPALAWIYAGSNSEILPLAIAFAWWCLPQIFFYGLYTLLGEVLNARRSFGPFTWVPVLNNLVALAGLVAFGLIFGFDPTGSRTVGEWTPGMVALLAGSATLGIAVQAIALFWFWRRIGLRYRPDFAWRGVGLGVAGRMAGWTFGMLLLTTVRRHRADSGGAARFGRRRLRGRDRQRVAGLHAAALGDHGVDRDRLLHAHERARARRRPSIGCATISRARCAG